MASGEPSSEHTIEMEDQISEMPAVSIVVLNYNGKSYLHECLKSVKEQQYPSFEIILVDNGSTDGSVDYVRTTFPEVRILALEKNYGFAGGNNRGISCASHDLIVLLNNDTRARPEWLAMLVKSITPRDIAAASSLILTEGIPAKYYEKNGSINFLGHNIMRIYERREEIFFAGGASLMFKKNLLGIPFDDDYFAYSEDVYLSLRARFLGYRVVHADDSRVDHFGGLTTKRLKNSSITFLQERNRLLNIFLFFSNKTILKILPVVLFNCIAKIILSLLPSKYSSWGILRSYWWFLTHGHAIIEKRKNLHQEKKVHEGVIISKMTCKITNGESSVGRMLNSIVYLYFKITGLRTIEFQV